MAYKDQLYQTKQLYPFNNWKKYYEQRLEQYAEEACERARKIFDTLIEKLISIGEDAGENEKIPLFQKAIESINELNEEYDEVLIETGEREELCELFNQITIAAGLNPDDYGDGEGLASEWREW